MMRMSSLLTSLTATLLFSLGQNAVADTVSVSGAVLKPGTYQWQPGTRLHNAVVAGQVRANAWFMGAALLRQSAIEPQQRLKTGILFDLRVNKLHARAQNNAALLELTERLDEIVSSLPATGRVQAELTPLQLMIPQKNALLEPGDHLIYPTRPDQVRVMGAVNTDCALVFDVTLKLKDYLRQCPAHPAADRNTVYIIQPDAQIEEVGIAYWNAQPLNIAVGAVIYRPVNVRMLSVDTPDLNRDMAELLATQYQLGGRFIE